MRWWAEGVLTEPPALLALCRAAVPMAVSLPEMVAGPPLLCVDWFQARQSVHLVCTLPLPTLVSPTVK